VRLVGLKITGRIPLPLRLTTCGLPEALSVIVSAPVLLPVAVGVKLTLTVQLPLGAMVALPQLLDWKLPVTAILLMMRLLVPVLVILRFVVAVAPTATLPKPIVVGDKLRVVPPTTVRSVDPLIVPEVAVIVAVPAATAVANPAALMVATLMAEDAQVAEFVRLAVVPSE
jgi:hypothetical protein